jgi:hypothetical protein
MPAPLSSDAAEAAKIHALRIAPAFSAIRNAELRGYFGLLVRSMWFFCSIFSMNAPGKMKPIVSTQTIM